ncbi:MFS general substrate transporter [Ramaria rubella]|nr:MFS general substrate transporter [Ramaria rubella]
MNVLGGVCINVCTFGFVNSYVFQEYYSQTLLPGSSASALSWIGSIQYALTFFPGLFTGRLFDLGHFRIPMLIFSVILVVSTLLVAECKSYWQFLLCQGFAIGLCSGILFGPTLNCIAHWFGRRRSTAYGIVAAGSSLGGTIFPIIIRNLIPRVGFPWTMRIVAFILLVFIGIANLSLRRRLPPVNVSGGLFNLRIFKYKPYTIYTISGFFTFLGLYTVLTYIDSSAAFYGVSPNLSFYLVAIANASSSMGRVMSGIVSDRIGPLNSVIPMTLVAALLTYAWPYARSATPLIIIAILYGFSSGAFVSLLSIPVVSMGDMGDVGRRQGMLFSLLAIGAVLGPPISGVINTATHGYTAVGFYAGSMVLAGAALMTTSRALVTGHILRGQA